MFVGLPLEEQYIVTNDETSKDDRYVTELNNHCQNHRNTKTTRYFNINPQFVQSLDEVCIYADALRALSSDQIRQLAKDIIKDRKVKREKEQAKVRKTK